MKQLLLLLITLTLFGNVFGQKIELTASLNSGLFSFKGVDATKNTYLRVDNSTGQCQVMSSIGSEGGLCYGLSLNLKKIIKKKYFFGVDIGYEVLRSRANIIAIEESTPIFSGQSYDVTYHIATGSAYTNNSFINTHPFIGYRCDYKKINFDLTAGMDIGYYLKVNESGNAKITDGTNYKVNDKYVYKGMDVDFRPGFQVSSSYKKYGVYFGYAYGVSDYYRGSLHDHIVTSKLIRFGLTYKLN